LTVDIFSLASGQILRLIDAKTQPNSRTSAIKPQVTNPVYGGRAHKLEAGEIYGIWQVNFK